MGGFEIDEFGNFFIPDPGLNRIQKFDSNGNYISQFGTAGTGNGEFSCIKDIVLDSNGDFYVADSCNDRIQKIGYEDFSLSASSLECETTYHYRSYATNSSGTSYGEDKTFTTGDCTSSRVTSVGYSRRNRNINSEKNIKDNGEICLEFINNFKIGSRGESVSKVQDILKNNNFNPGPVDGIFGPMTNTAVKEFQKKNNLVSDGIVGPKTRAVLNNFY